MTKRNSRQDSTTNDPLMKRERHPHRSGQEYEYGETPETGLGGGGGGADPDKAFARTSEPSPAERASEEQPPTSTRQGGGGAEDQGFARGRDEKHAAGNKGGRRAKFDDQHAQPNIRGEHGLPPEAERDR